LAFSLAAALWDGRLAGSTPVTVFSRSAYTLARPDGAVADVTALRRREDRRFFRATGAGMPLWLELADAPLRRSLGRDTIFSVNVSEQERDDVVAAVKNVLHTSSKLLVPLGLGGHVDHRIVRDAAVFLYRQHGCEIIFYEDLPYAAFMPLCVITESVRQLETALDARLCARYWPSASLVQAKQCAVDSYASQTDAGTLAALLGHAYRLRQSALPAERIWAPCIR
jgi:LmbE family N-acetylglucosaminyl deacetylase